MSEGQAVTLADVYELISKEHAVTSQKLEGLRAEGRMRETELLSAINRTEVNMRAYVDEGYREVRQGVLNETTCLQTGLDQLHSSIFGNGDMEKSIAYRLKSAEDMQARWIKVINRLLVGIGLPLTLSILGALWMLISGQWELMVH